MPLRSFQNSSKHSKHRGKIGKIGVMMGSSRKKALISLKSIGQNANPLEIPTKRTRSPGIWRKSLKLLPLKLWPALFSSLAALSEWRTTYESWGSPKNRKRRKNEWRREDCSLTWRSYHFLAKVCCSRQRKKDTLEWAIFRKSKLFPLFSRNIFQPYVWSYFLLFQILWIDASEIFWFCCILKWFEKTDTFAIVWDTKSKKGWRGSL